MSTYICFTKLKHLIFINRGSSSWAIAHSTRTLTPSDRQWVAVAMVLCPVAVLWAAAAMLETARPLMFPSRASVTARTGSRRSWSAASRPCGRTLATSCWRARLGWLSGRPLAAVRWPHCAGMLVKCSCVGLCYIVSWLFCTMLFALCNMYNAIWHSVIWYCVMLYGCLGSVMNFDSVKFCCYLEPCNCDAIWLPGYSAWEV
jgi:hypothetical protein